jgi:hypothetical protein
MTGPLSDRIGRKGLIAGGMVVQAGGNLADGVRAGLPGVDRGRGAPGTGDGNGVPDAARRHRGRRPSSVAGHELRRHRLWRDLGYAVGAFLAGLVADWLGMEAAIHVVAALTLMSGVLGHGEDARDPGCLALRHGVPGGLTVVGDEDRVPPR